MDLYLIRHGETVDNVAGLYAGVRDSALTNYGVDQAKRLGEHFAKNGVIFTNIFASPLSRALKTAQAIASNQPPPEAERSAVDIVQVKDLIEQDFGYYEGKNFQARSDDKKSGRDAHREKHKNDPGFVDVETHESMNKRADMFLEQHLLPLFVGSNASKPGVVAVVSHGILLSHLWRRLLLRLPPKSVTVAPEVTAARGTIVLEHLGGWSNTGYLELRLSRLGAPPLPSSSPQRIYAPEKESEPAWTTAPTELVAATSPAVPPTLDNWTTLIVAIDRKDHLVGLKRQRGGIGRSAHDEKQGKIDGFFKRQRTK